MVVPRDEPYDMGVHIPAHSVGPATTGPILAQRYIDKRRSWYMLDDLNGKVLTIASQHTCVHARIHVGSSHMK